jgi:predicted transcriptional regulator
MLRHDGRGLTDFHYVVLYWVSTHPDACPDDIATGLDIPVALVVKFCTELRAAGLIEDSFAQQPALAR